MQHPNVMRCYAYHRGARDRRFYIVMELLQGPNLEQVRSQTHQTGVNPRCRHVTRMTTSRMTFENEKGVSQTREATDPS